MLSSPQIMVPVSCVGEYPELQERVNCLPEGLGAEGVVTAECSILNGPLHVLGWHSGLFSQTLFISQIRVPVSSVAE